MPRAPNPAVGERGRTRPPHRPALPEARRQDRRGLLGAVHHDVWRVERQRRRGGRHLDRLHAAVIAPGSALSCRRARATRGPVTAPFFSLPRGTPGRKAAAAGPVAEDEPTALDERAKRAHVLLGGRRRRARQHEDCRAPARAGSRSPARTTDRRIFQGFEEQIRGPGAVGVARRNSTRRCAAARRAAPPGTTRRSAAPCPLPRRRGPSDRSFARTQASKSLQVIRDAARVIIRGRTVAVPDLLEAPGQVEHQPRGDCPSPGSIGRYSRGVRATSTRQTPCSSRRASAAP